jgi:hypothetical protein
VLSAAEVAVRTVTEYTKHAEHCCRMARRATSPADKTILENMARSWEMLAQLRKRDLEPEQEPAATVSSTT